MRVGAILGLGLMLVAGVAQACDTVAIGRRLGAGSAVREMVLADLVDRAGPGCLTLVAAGDDPAVLAGVADGTMQLGLVAQGALGLAVLDLPFLFPDTAAVERFLAGPIGAEALGAAGPPGTRGLAFWQAGMMQLAADRGVRLPDDLAGLGAAVPGNQVSRAALRALGVAAGAGPLREAPWSTLADSPPRTATETNHRIEGEVLLVDAAWWQGLDPAVRATLAQQIAEATHDHNRLRAEVEDLARLRLVQDGTAVHRLSPSERNAWVSRVAGVWRAFETTVGAAVIAAALDASAP